MSLPPQINPESLELDPSAIQRVDILRSTAAHVVCRVVGGQGRFILKWFNSPGSIELQTYALLERCGVETLPAHKRAGQAILLEDLESSLAWRLASEADMEQPATGAAVAAWYRQLHRAGREALGDPQRPAAFLAGWVDLVTQPALEKAGAVFGFQHQRGWIAALEQLEWLRAAYLSQPQTFNYNDFAAENLALSKSMPLRAVVFDYDCFALGAAYSDWRNVTYSLRGAAKASFQAAFGPVSEKERLLDEPLSLLHGLVVASQRKVTSKWADPLVGAVIAGELEKSILLAKRFFEQGGMEAGEELR
ncbi:MAG: hypothetical protein EHM81_11050 [Chloroflexi bacterium]|nr:MAG: hypothetical protein EHM81_11050 [Chloroflexota bacterium]